MRRALVLLGALRIFCLPAARTEDELPDLAVSAGRQAAEAAMNELEKVLILDFGSQYTQLIARLIRRLGVFCRIVPHDTPCRDIQAARPVALVFSGGPASVCQPDSPRVDEAILHLGIPVLGICYGMQLMAQALGGEVAAHGAGEYGPASVEIIKPEGLFAGVGGPVKVWMSHGDMVDQPPPGFEALGRTADCPIAAMGDPERKLYGVQFHPEVVHTQRGEEMLGNFLFGVAGCRGGWTMANFIERSVGQIQARVGDGRVICGVSGGVDSSVTAALVARAVGDQMVGIFVDNGLLRAGEREQIEQFFRKDYPLNLQVIDARDRFIEALKGVTDPEEKRKAIGKAFIDVFSQAARRIGGIEFLAQGTLYPDVIESVSARGGPSATIKSHHNVGGLPDDLRFELIEPLRELFKDEVRQLGAELGLPRKLLDRQPFPGPGLAVRIIGDVTEDRLAVLRQADAVVQKEMEAWDRYNEIWQSFAVLLPIKTVGVMGDERTYANVVTLRIVTSIDGMTADWARLPHELLERISARIINEVAGVNRVTYDISSKPPSTIEWE